MDLGGVETLAAWERGIFSAWARGYVMPASRPINPASRPINIDTEQDLAFVACLLQQKENP